MTTRGSIFAAVGADRPCSGIALADIADALAAILAHPSAHAHKTYTLR
jgi:uncharacterized protein YbjT (DUF2867 family)